MGLNAFGGGLGGLAAIERKRKTTSALEPYRADYSQESKDPML